MLVYLQFKKTEVIRQNGEKNFAYQQKRKELDFT